ncbi:hypothetical protein EJB05_33729, partial [Eragrostis curvula]
MCGVCTGATTTSTTGQFLFLLNVARHLLSCAISVLCIHPHHIYGGQGQSSKAIQCALRYSWRLEDPLFDHYLSSGLRVGCTDLSDGLPDHEMCFKFVVPNSALKDRDKQEAIDVDPMNMEKGTEATTIWEIKSWVKATPMTTGQGKSIALDHKVSH